MEKDTANQNNNRFRVDDKTMASYEYNLLDTTRRFLFTFDNKGDTLCRFPNYNPLPVIKKTAAYNHPPDPDIYYWNGQLTVRQPLNDTVYRVVSPNKLVPAYVLNFGSYRIEVQNYLYGDSPEKLCPSTWKEANQYILFFYIQNRESRNNRKFFYSYYDKKSRQFYHFCEGTTIPEQEFFIENPLPDGLPFILSYVDISENQLRVVYSKKRLENIIKNKQFASLPPEQQNKINTMQSDLGESEVLIMILE